jgi:hypothetical protein
MSIDVDRTRCRTCFNGCAHGLADAEDDMPEGQADERDRRLTAFAVGFPSADAYDEELLQAAAFQP